jgi:hypothetical protein
MEHPAVIDALTRIRDTLEVESACVEVPQVPPPPPPLPVLNLTFLLGV